MEERKKPGKKKGSPKTGGRQPGSKNKKSIYLREILEVQDFDFGKEWVKAFSKLPDSDKIQILQQLLPYVAPRLLEKEVAPIEEEGPCPSFS